MSSRNARTKPSARCVLSGVSDCCSGHATWFPEIPVPSRRACLISASFYFVVRICVAGLAFLQFLRFGLTLYVGNVIILFKGFPCKPLH